MTKRTPGRAIRSEGHPFGRLPDFGARLLPKRLSQPKAGRCPPRSRAATGRPRTLVAVRRIGEVAGSEHPKATAKPSGSIS